MQADIFAIFGNFGIFRLHSMNMWSWIHWATHCCYEEYVLKAEYETELTG